MLTMCSTDLSLTSKDEPSEIDPRNKTKAIQRNPARLPESLMTYCPHVCAAFLTISSLMLSTAPPASSLPNDDHQTTGWRDYPNHAPREFTSRSISGENTFSAHIADSSPDQTLQYVADRNGRPCEWRSNFRASYAETWKGSLATPRTGPSRVAS